MMIRAKKNSYKVKHIKIANRLRKDESRFGEGAKINFFIIFTFLKCFLYQKELKLKKKLIFLLHGPMSKREYITFGINYLKKNFNLLVVEISPIVDSSHYKFKRHYNFKIIKNFKELNNFLAKK